MAAAPAASPQVWVDPTAQALCRGDAAPTFGMNLQVMSPPTDAAFLAEYEALARRLREAGGSALHVYDPKHLHITVASPIVFFSATEAFPDEESRAELTAKLVAAMDAACTPANGFFSKAFALRARAVERRERAVIVLYDDESGAIERARECMETLRGLPDLKVARLFDKAAGGFKMPRGIVHTTVARYVAAPGEAGSAAELAWCEAVDRACAAWKPVSFPVTETLLVKEAMPYMHLDSREHVEWSRTLAAE